MKKEEMANKVIGIIKSKSFDNNKIYSEMKRKVVNETHFSHAKFNDPAALNNDFYKGHELEIIRKLEQIENDSDWTISIYYSIFGGKKPNDIHFICIYDPQKGFVIHYLIESDHSHLL